VRLNPKETDAFTREFDASVERRLYVRTSLIQARAHERCGSDRNVAVWRFIKCTYIYTRVSGRHGREQQVYICITANQAR
jgi:hypothetical protein